MSDETSQDLTPKKRPRWAKAFLTAFAESGNVRLACEAASVSRTAAYNLRAADEAFAADWDSASNESADLLEQEARRRAHDGVQRLKFHNGTIITIPVPSADGTPLLDKDGRPVMVPYVEHEYSDTLLIFLLKGAKPEKYRDRQQLEHIGKDGGAILLAPAPGANYRTGLDTLKPDDADT